MLKHHARGGLDDSNAPASTRRSGWRGHQRTSFGAWSSREVAGAVRGSRRRHTIGDRECQRTLLPGNSNFADLGKPSRSRRTVKWAAWIAPRIPRPASFIAVPSVHDRRGLAGNHLIGSAAASCDRSAVIRIPRMRGKFCLAKLGTQPHFSNVQPPPNPFARS